MRRFLFVLAVLGLAAVALADPFVWKNAWTAAQPGAAVMGGTLRDYDISDPRTFNPITSAETSVVTTMLDTHGAALLTRGPDSDSYLPYAASSFQVSDDGTVLDVTLRDGITWSDGTPVTTQDYYDRYVIETDPDVGANGHDLWFIGDDQIRLEKIGDHGLRFTFPGPDRLAFSQAGGLRPVPDKVFGEAYRSGGADAVKALWGTGSDIAQVLTTGPFRPVSYTPGERVVFERNPYFGEWNVDEQGNPLPYLAGYESTIVTDQDAALNLYLAGDIDVFNPRNLDDIGTINVAVQNGDLDATVIENASPVASSQFIVFNWNKASEPTKQALFRSLDFRRAMAHLIDKQAIIELVYGGSASPMSTSVYKVLTDWVNSDVPTYDYDPEAAAQLLAKVGLSQKNSDGILLDSDGNPVSFTLATNSGNNQREQIAQIFADSARKVGVDVKVESLDFNLLVDQLLSTGDDRPFDAILIGLSGGSRDWPYTGQLLGCTGNLHMFNTSGACLFPQETLISELIAKGRRTIDDTEAHQIADEIQTAEAQLVPILYTVSPGAHYSWLNSVQGQHPAGLINAIVGSRELEMTYKTQ